MDKLTLESAIQHCEDVATQCENGEFTIPKLKECASEYHQFAEWLKELKAYREKQEIPTGCVDNPNCNDCIHNSICTWRGAKFCDWYVQDCSDAISRQAVIDGINEYFHDEYYQRTSIQDCRDCLIEDVIKSSPSVTPQQRTGRWIPVGYYDWWECSECEWEHTGDEKSLTAFCPNCGAKMEVEE